MEEVLAVPLLDCLPSWESCALTIHECPLKQFCEDTCAVMGGRGEVFFCFFFNELRCSVLSSLLTQFMSKADPVLAKMKGMKVAVGDKSP